MWAELFDPPPIFAFQFRLVYDHGFMRQSEEANHFSDGIEDEIGNCKPLFGARDGMRLEEMFYTQVFRTRKGSQQFMQGFFRHSAEGVQDIYDLEGHPYFLFNFRNSASSSFLSVSSLALRLGFGAGWLADHSSASAKARAFLGAVMSKLAKILEVAIGISSIVEVNCCNVREEMLFSA